MSKMSSEDFQMLEVYIHAVASKSIAQLVGDKEAEKQAGDIANTMRGYFMGTLTREQSLAILDNLNKEQN